MGRLELRQGILGPSSQLLSNRFVILRDRRSRGFALELINGLGGDYTLGKCEAPTLSVTKPHRLTFRWHLTSFEAGIICVEMKSIYMFKSQGKN